MELYCWQIRAAYIGQARLTRGGRVGTLFCLQSMLRAKRKERFPFRAEEAFLKDVDQPVARAGEEAAQLLAHSRQPPAANKPTAGWCYTDALSRSANMCEDFLAVRLIRKRVQFILPAFTIWKKSNVAGKHSLDADNRNHGGCRIQ